jgi:prepilin-type N-terminal cleavage/methylation domain-containing protein
MLNKKIVKAFTLLELIVVIVVLGILAMLAVPTFNTVKEKSADSVANKNASAVQRDYNAQAALAASDSTITPSGFGFWLINGDSYSYTATAGNTGQSVTAAK